MKVVNLRKEKHTVYIGRGSIFGNPFVIGRNGSRNNVIKKYENWIKQNLWKGTKLTKRGQAIYNLPENAILGCFCKPKACHGDIIIKIWEEFHDKLGKI